MDSVLGSHWFWYARNRDRSGQRQQRLECNDVNADDSIDVGPSRSGEHGLHITAAEREIGGGIYRLPVAGWVERAEHILGSSGNRDTWSEARQLNGPHRAAGRLCERTIERVHLGVGKHRTFVSHLGVILRGDQIGARAVGAKERQRIRNYPIAVRKQPGDLGVLAVEFALGGPERSPQTRRRSGKVSELLVSYGDGRLELLQLGDINVSPAAHTGQGIHLVE